MSEQDAGFTGIKRLTAGNGVVFPFVAYVRGEMLRTTNGVGRRFMTERAAENAVQRELRRNASA